MSPHPLPRRPLFAALASLPLTAAAQAAPDGSLRRVLEARVIRLGVQVEGTVAASHAPDGRLRGYLPELGRRIASGLGVQAEFVAVPRGDMLGLLQSNRFDLGLGGAIASPWVALTALLSDPIMQFQLVALTSERQPVQGMADLHGRRVGVVEGRSFVEAVRDAGVEEERVITYATWEQAAQALIRGSEDVAIVPGYHVPEIQRAAPRVVARFTLGDFWHCAMLPLGHHDLLRALNVLLYLLRQEGELGALHQAFFDRGLSVRRTL